MQLKVLHRTDWYWVTSKIVKLQISVQLPRRYFLHRLSECPWIDKWIKSCWLIHSWTGITRADVILGMLIFLGFFLLWLETNFATQHVRAGFWSVCSLLPWKHQSLSCPINYPRFRLLRKNKRILLAGGKQLVAPLVAQNIRKALEMYTFEICNFLGFGAFSVSFGFFFSCCWQKWFSSQILFLVWDITACPAPKHAETETSF